MSEFQTLETPFGLATLLRRPRRTLAISVLPDGALELIAPENATESEILAKVVKRELWIDRRRREFSEMNATRSPKRYVSGATHRYLGRQYRLKIRKGTAYTVKLRGAYFEINCPAADELKLQEQLDAWFRTKAAQQFQRRIEAWIPWCRRNRLPEPRLVLRRMKKRWGSASPSGRIALNPELIHAPSACIDYVIAHEVCHLKHPSHGPAFFRLLSAVLPNWKELKTRLEVTEI